MSNIGIVIIATNAYFILGIRFIKKFMYHYKGNKKIKFYFYSDTDPKDYLSDNIDVEFYYNKHTNWVEGTNSKFINIISLENCNIDYLYYFDADTNIINDFTEEWFLGDLVGGEHFGNRGWLAGGVNFDKNPLSKAYVPADTHLPCVYYYGAFFGGKKDKMIELCKVLRYNQLEDKKINYEPGVNDESYINQYFHYNPPTYTVSHEQFAFTISDKGGIGETRNTALDINKHKKLLLTYKDDLFDIQNNVISVFI